MKQLLPYVFNGMYEWMLDQGLIPEIVINTQIPGVSIPDYLYDEPFLILNIDPNAIRDFVIDDDGVSFSTKFTQVSHNVFFPLKSVVGMQSRGGLYQLSMPPVIEDPKEKPSVDIPTKPKDNKSESKKKTTLPPYMKVIK